MFKKNYLPLTLFVLLLTLWEVVCRSSETLLFVLPPPSQILKALQENQTRLLFHSLITLKEMALGFLCALFASFPLAWAMVRFKTTRAFFQPFFVVIQCLPMFTLAPIMVIWFGWSETAIIVPTALMIFFPLTLNIYQGLRSTPEELLDFFESNGATTWQTFIKLRLPAALPHIFAGFRISAAIAGIGAVAGEWAGAQNGLGMVMLESRRNTDLEITFSALLLLTILSLSFYSCVVVIEKMALRHSKTRILSKKTFLLCALLLPLLPGCHPREEKKVKLLLDWLPSPTHVPLFVGIEQGFFREAGIDLEINKMHESGGGIAFLNSGCADLLVGRMPSALKAMNRGAHLKIVGVMIKEPLSCLLYRKECGVQEKKDLSNLRFGYCLGNSDSSFIRYLLEESDIHPKESLHVGVDLISAIATSRVDFLFGTYWNIEPHQFRSLGIDTKYFPLTDFGVPSYYELVILAEEGKPFSEKIFATAFQSALQQSLDFCKKHPDKAFEAYTAANPDKTKKTITWEKEAWKETVKILADDQSIDQKMFNTLVEWLGERNFISKEKNYLELINSY